MMSVKKSGGKNEGEDRNEIKMTYTAIQEYHDTTNKDFKVN